MKSARRYTITLTNQQVGLIPTTISNTLGNLSASKIEELTFEGPNTVVKCDASQCQAKSTFVDYNMQLRLVYLQGKAFKLSET